MNDTPTLQSDLTEELKKIGVKDAEGVISEFDLLTITTEAEDLVRETAKKIRDRIEAYAHLLEDLLQPDASLAAMNECSHFSEQDMELIVKTYRKLMALIRKFTVTDITDQDYAALVTGSLDEWAKHKPALQKIAKKLESGWEQNQPLQRGEHGYFG